jgi:hypothetical protein
MTDQQPLVSAGHQWPVLVQSFLLPEATALATESEMDGTWGWRGGREGAEMRYYYKYFESRCLLPDLTDAGGRRKD